MSDKIIQKQFDKFYENIQLTENQKQDAITKYEGVCKKLHSIYYPNLNYDGSTKFLIGSYAKDTEIRPARDIDVIFKMPQDLLKNYNDNTSNSQSQLLQDVRKILKERYPTTNIGANQKVVEIITVEGNHNIEIVPAWDNNIFTIPNSSNGGSWEYVDYRKDIKTINDSNNKTGKTKRLIKMLKKWKEQNATMNLSSYDIEKAVINFFESVSEKYDDDSLLIKDFFNYLKNSYSYIYILTFIESAINRSNKAISFENENKLDEAIEEWIKIFGSDFPKTIQKTFIISNLGYSSSKIKNYKISPNEEFIQDLCEVAIKQEYNTEVKYDIVTKDNGRDNYYIVNISINNIKRFFKKKLSLKFNIITNVQEPYYVKWKVRNFGEQAERVNDLRGEIINDEGNKTKIENTKYKGEHYVECYIIKNNKCVSIGNILVPVGDSE